MSDPSRPDPHRKDYAFLAEGPHAVTHDEQMFSGALSFCRRKYARDLDGVDVAVVGVPFDQATSGRPGARFGPRAIREASTNLCWSHAWPSPFDPFQKMAVVDWGDVHIEHWNTASTPSAIQSAMATILAARSNVPLTFLELRSVRYLMTILEVSVLPAPDSPVMSSDWFCPSLIMNLKS